MNAPASQALIAIGGTLFGVMLIMALIRRPGGVRKGNRLLAIALVCNLGYLATIGSSLFNVSLPWPIACLAISAFMLAPVFLLGYVRSLIRPHFTLDRNALIHLLPATLIFFAALIAVGDVQNFTEMMKQARGGWPPNGLALLGLAAYLFQICYLGRSLYELRQHRQQVAEDFSYTENVTLTWLRLLIGLSFLLACTGLLIALIRLIPGIELWPRSIYSMTTVLLIYYVIAFKGLSQPVIFEHSSEQGTEPSPTNDSKAGEDSSDREADNGVLPASVEIHYWEQLQAAMARDKPFLDSKLRIADLATRLDMPVHHLSQTINRRAQESFSDFINRYRVETAKALLETDQQAVTSVAFDAGFNSESAFYRHFKNFTGKTPSQFRAEISPSQDPANF